MSGIRTLEDVRQRCWIDDETQCWHWRGAVSCGVPRVWSWDESQGQMRTMTGARAVWHLAGRGKLGGRIAYHAHCTSGDCLNPGHLEAGTKAEAGASLAARGHLRGDPLRSLTNTRNARRRSRYSPELRRAICESTEPATTLGPKLGISRATVSYVRQGLRWRDGAPQSSVFRAAA